MEPAKLGKSEVHPAFWLPHSDRPNSLCPAASRYWLALLARATGARHSFRLVSIVPVDADYVRFFYSRRLTEKALRFYNKTPNFCKLICDPVVLTCYIHPVVWSWVSQNSVIFWA